MPRNPRRAGQRKAASAATREAWQAMVELVMEQRRAWPGRIQDLGLAPNQAQALRHLHRDAPITMSGLAERLGVDNSNVTTIVSRLEEAGLVERRPAPHDRRVRIIVITDEGEAVRDEVTRRLTEPPPALQRLRPAEARSLRDALTRARDQE